MLKLLDSPSLKKERYSPRVYVVAETDSMSGKKAFEKEKLFQGQVHAGSCRSLLHPPPSLALPITHSSGNTHHSS